MSDEPEHPGQLLFVDRCRDPECPKGPRQHIHVPIPEPEPTP